LGRAALSALQGVGAVVLFALEGVSHLFRPPFYGRLFLRQVVEIGYFSLPVVALTAFFTGMVLALQTYTGFARFNAEGAVANVVVLSITRELGPVIAGLMVAGRIGASFAAEIGTMRVTDQIDALTTLSTNPMKYLVAPRLLAGAIALPFLVLIADTLGVMGGWLIGTAKLGFSSAGYLRATLDFMQTMDVVSGLVKASVFGFVIALMGCWCGYNSKGGAQGVGAATTSAVVISSILILALDYIITEMFFAR
jgi:phospholipid/cholesterol/gamma-HCH transport system permease protein